MFVLTCVYVCMEVCFNVCVCACVCVCVHVRVCICICVPGVALGGFVGGALFFTVGGSRTFLYTGIFNTVFAVLHVTLQLMLNSCTTLHTQPG